MLTIAKPAEQARITKYSFNIKSSIDFKRNYPIGKTL